MRRGKVISTGGTVTIRGGQVIDKHLARLVCRCAECLGPVELHNNGLACAADKSHRGLIHRKEAEIEAARRAGELMEVEQNYVIQNGQLVALDDLTGVSNAD
jgi:preprotein translocase subunit SecA